jgi:hypothetical protein
MMATSLRTRASRWSSIVTWMPLRLLGQAERSEHFGVICAPSRPITRRTLGGVARSPSGEPITVQSSPPEWNGL